MFCKKSISKLLPCLPTESTGRITFYVLNCVSKNMSLYSPTLRKFGNTGNLSPFKITTIPTWMILIRYDIHTKVFLSITLISNFLLRESMPDLISNIYSLPSMITMQQKGSPSKCVIPMTVKRFSFFVAFICAIQPLSKINFSRPICPSAVMLIFTPT